MSEPETFANRKQALGWLRGEGYKISQGKFYQDCKAGFPAVGKDGSVSKYQVLLYGQQLVAATEPDEPLSAREDDMRKSRADADIAEMKAEKMRREQDHLWLHAEDAYAQVAGLIGTLRDAIRHHLYVGQEEIVHVADGDQDRCQEVFELTDEVVSRAFNEVAGGEVKVTFEREVE